MYSRKKDYWIDNFRFVFSEYHYQFSSFFGMKTKGKGREIFVRIEKKRSFIKLLGRGTSELGGSCASKNKRSFNLTLREGRNGYCCGYPEYSTWKISLPSFAIARERRMSLSGLRFSCLSVLISLHPISY